VGQGSIRNEFITASTLKVPNKALMKLMTNYAGCLPKVSTKRKIEPR